MVTISININAMMEILHQVMAVLLLAHTRVDTSAMEVLLLLRIHAQKSAEMVKTWVLKLVMTETLQAEMVAVPHVPLRLNGDVKVELNSLKIPATKSAVTVTILITTNATTAIRLLVTVALPLVLMRQDISVMEVLQPQRILVLKSVEMVYIWEN